MQMQISTSGKKQISTKKDKIPDRSLSLKAAGAGTSPEGPFTGTLKGSNRVPAPG